MDARNTAKAEKLTARYNREADRIEALQTRLYELELKHRETYKAAFDALPADGSIVHDHGRISVWTEQESSSADVDHSCVRCSGGSPRFCACISRCGFPNCGAPERGRPLIDVLADSDAAR
jgi:hypothetical protein